MNLTVRETNGLFYIAMENTELEGIGDTMPEALRDLAEQLEVSQI